MMKRLVVGMLDLASMVPVQMAAQSAEDRRMGRPLPVVAGLMLATAETHGLTLVTRNVSDCSGRGVAIFDPWTGGTP